MSRHTSARSVGWGLLFAILGLLLGTYLGRHLGAQASILSRSLTFGPNALNLLAFDVTVRVDTNLLGLIGAALGAFVAVTRR